ncbi:tyrosine-protein phosphatase [Terribacillus aidingensis]|uniref:tyrosine-protein phosphatase n=1 Tax=Terribacillus aidingensis TaxID=586416 RepID=UPI003450DE27
MPDRKDIYKFEKLYNFRDIGGLPTKNGRMMKTGILFRSGELSRLSKKDFKKFNQLNINSICDLRTLNEQKSNITAFKVIRRYKY